MTARCALLVVSLGIALSVRCACAQVTADVLRGRVTGPDSLPIMNASVMATSMQGGITKYAKTDRNGRFSIMFPNGEGDYWVAVAAIGYTQKRFEVKRLIDDEILIADARLGPAMLERVDVIAPGERRTASRTDNAGDVSGTDKRLNVASVAAADAGNLAALAAGLPGFQFIAGVDGLPDAFSALGLSPDQNNFSLNGALGNGANVPRDAAAAAIVSTTSWDVSKGGFSAANVSLNTSSGTNFSRRTNSGQFETPRLQFTDKIGGVTGADHTRYSVGGLMSGPLKLDKDFYNFSYQVDRTTSDLRTLFSTDPLGLASAGISADSATRLSGILQGLGIPLVAAGAPGARATTTARLLGSIDLAPSSPTSGHAFQITGAGNWTRRDQPNSGLLAAQSSGAGSQTTVGQGVARHTNYFWNKVLTETWVSGSVSDITTDAYLQYPTGTVRVNSLLPDGSSAVRTMMFGGSPALTTSRLQSFVGVRNQLRWFSENNQHALKLTSELRRDWFSSRQEPNPFGTFSFLSLGDLETGQPSAYVRQLGTTALAGNQIVGALSFGDSWRPSQDVQVQYGLRADANRFLSRPVENPVVGTTFGVGNTHVPNRVYFSPRVGFSWAYGTAGQIPARDGFVSGPRATVRGGIGVFQNIADPQLVAAAIGQTGLTGSARQLVCIGPAAPAPTWTAYSVDSEAMPPSCAGGTSTFSSSVPSLTMFDPHFVQSRSLRTNINWGGAVLNDHFTARLDATYSWNLNAMGALDLNFKPSTQFALGNEGGRPVYASSSSIDPLTGRIASQAARVSPAFGRVTQLRSDLQSRSLLVTAAISPLNYNPTHLTWSVSYTLQDLRDEYRGFSSTVGNPLDKVWGISSQPRHQVQYRVQYNLWDYVSVNWFGSFVSGTRFTPTIAGDVNGDGSAQNDRAFVFDPATVTDPALKAGMQSVLRSGSASARSCLAGQIGHFAGRNSCAGPWTVGASYLRIEIQPYKIKLPPRVTPYVAIANPLAAMDLLLHGENGLRGWGVPRSPDPVLFAVAGFDPVAQRYKYQVNQRFGATSAQQTSLRSPVVITVGFSVDIAPPQDWQGFRMQLDRGRERTGTKLGEAALKAAGENALINPMARILQAAGVLGLSQVQADSLAVLSLRFTEVLDSVWAPVAKYLVGPAKDYSADEARERFGAARVAAVTYLIKVAPAVKRLLTGTQWRRLPAGLANFLEPRYLARVRAGMAAASIVF